MEAEKPDHCICIIQKTLLCSRIPQMGCPESGINKFVNGIASGVFLLHETVIIQICFGLLMTIFIMNEQQKMYTFHYSLFPMSESLKSFLH